MKKYLRNKVLCTSLAAGSVFAAQGAVTILTDPGQIAAFKAGATVENFDDLTGLSISAYAPPVDATGFTFSSRNAATSPTFDSGGATPSNPASNPGLPVAVLKPTVGIAGDVSSPGNVIGPVAPDFNPGATPTALDPTGFMEVALPQSLDAIKIGFFVTHGTVNVQVQDDSLTALDILTSVPAGSFVAFTRNSAEIRNVSFTSTGVFTIDDFTYAFTAGTGSTTTPDGGATLSMAFSLFGLGLVKWKLRGRKA
jgi:hypothetical protein